jgi:hypothetical protein
MEKSKKKIIPIKIKENNKKSLKLEMNINLKDPKEFMKSIEELKKILKNNN